MIAGDRSTCQAAVTCLCRPPELWEKAEFDPPAQLRRLKTTAETLKGRSSALRNGSVKFLASFRVHMVS